MKRSASILVLTNGPLARNPRVVKEASALAAAGHRVTVLGVRNHRPSVALDAEIIAEAAFRHEQIDLLDGPRAWLRRAAVRLARDCASRGGLATIHALGPASALLRRARAIPADLVIVHNEIAHWAGLRMIAAGRRVAADIEDWHSEDLLPEHRVGRPLSSLRRVERALLHRAAYVSTTSHALAEGLHARYGGRRPAVITNSFSLPPAPRSAAGEPPSFFWFSQTTGPGRGLEAFATAWAGTSSASRLVLLGQIAGDFDRRILGLLPESRRRDVEFLPPVPPAALPGLIARHDIGLALEQPDIVNRDLTITNKILQYLGGGLSIVATPTAGQREVMANAPEAGVLESFADPVAAAGVLDALLADRNALAARRAAARRLAESRYCWEQEAPNLVLLAEQALSRPWPGTQFES
ncbi:MAG: hypothetical protein RLZZ50_1645 [Verrucomicrobiota bacterium]